MVMIIDLINVVCSIALIPLTIFTAGLFILRKRAAKGGEKQKKRYLKFRKLHIPLGIATLILGIFHAGFASWKHGWYFSFGKLCLIFLVALVLVYVFRKRMRRWIVFHRIFTIGFVVSMVLHIAFIPLTMDPNSMPKPAGMMQEMSKE